MPTGINGLIALMSFSSIFNMIVWLIFVKFYWNEINSFSCSFPVCDWHLYYRLGGTRLGFTPLIPLDTIVMWCTRDFSKCPSLGLHFHARSDLFLPSQSAKHVYFFLNYIWFFLPFLWLLLLDIFFLPFHKRQIN